MCQLHGSTLTPPIYFVLPIALFCAGLGSLMIVIALSTSAWEEVTWDNSKLKQVSSVNVSESIFDNNNGFYKIITQDNQGNRTTSYLRNTIGGIWQICDTLTGKI